MASGSSSAGVGMPGSAMVRAQSWWCSFAGSGRHPTPCAAHDALAEGARGDLPGRTYATMDTAATGATPSCSVRRAQDDSGRDSGSHLSEGELAPIVFGGLRCRDNLRSRGLRCGSWLLLIL